MSSYDKRQSNFELLRIVAMAMIVIFHIIYHATLVQLTDKEVIKSACNGFFSQPIIIKRLLFMHIVMTFGSIGNALFILISGYFMVPKNQSIRLAKISWKLLSQLGFAVIVLVLMSTVVVRYAGINGKPLIDFADVSYFNTMNWFVGYYFLIILCATLFLNRILNSLDKKRYTIYLISFFVLIQFGWSMDLIDNLASGSSILLTGIFLFSLGGYIRLYNPFEHIKNTIVIGLFIVMPYIFVCVSSYNIAARSIAEYYHDGASGVFVHPMSDFSNRSIITILVSVAVFELFRRLRLRCHKFINYLAQSVFMVYLIHENQFIRSLIRTTDWLTPLYRSPYVFVLEWLLWGIAIFVFGVICYFCYRGCVLVVKKYKQSAERPKREA